MSEMNLEFLLGAMPPGNATLYRVLIQLIPAPSPESTVAASRQIKLQVLAERTGFSKRWVIQLLQRLEKKNFIRTEGGSGAVQWIRLLPLGVPLLGGSEANQSSRKEATSPEAKAPRAAARRPKHRRQETAQSPKPGAEVNVALPVEKPAMVPARRQEGPMPSIPPAPDDPAVLATAFIPPPPPAPTDPTVPAAMMPPPPPATPPGGPAPDNPVVAAATVTPAPSKAPGGPAVRSPRVRATKIAPPPSTAPDGPAGNPVAPAAMVTPEPAAPATTAKRVSPRKSNKKLPAGRSHWESAPIEELVAYAYSQPVTPELIHSLKTPGMTGGLLVLALERLCQQIERNERKPYPDRSLLVTALRTIVSDL